MQGKCSNPDCPAPKGLCAETMSHEYHNCDYWDSSAKENSVSKANPKSKGSNPLPWSGLEMTPDDLGLFSSRSTPIIIGAIGAANAGKTSYLGMLYTLLFNGYAFDRWNFSGSYSLIAWEKLAQYLRIKPSGTVEFPEPTPANPGFYNLYHLALRKDDDQLYDVLFADSSGEVYSSWAENIDDSNVDSARWIYKHSSAFVFFIDCEALISQRGAAKQQIALLAQQVAANLNGRPLAVVWSKADRIKEVRENIKIAVEETVKTCFPNSTSFEISNFSKDDPDTLCHVNNLGVTESLIDAVSSPPKLKLDLFVEQSTDFFFNYRGKYGA